MAETNQAVSVQKSRDIQRAAPGRAISPFEEMDRLMDRMWENFFPRRFLRPSSNWDTSEMARFDARVPNVDVIDRENEVLVRAELPGVQKKDLDVSIRDSAVNIKATTEYEEKNEEGDYYRYEVGHSSFARTIPLPTEVDGEKAKASFKDGILELTLPKIERSKARHLTIE